MVNSYEVEIKALLGSEEDAQRLVEALHSRYPEFATAGSHRQLNHYFIGGSLILLGKNLHGVLRPEDEVRFAELADRANDFSLRTRLADQKLLLVLKASVDDTTSANGTARLEYEAEVPDLTLDALDTILIGSGFTYQAKWSRERAAYTVGDISVSIDKNAGYGYLAEFELIVDDTGKTNAAKDKLRAFISTLGVMELDQGRLSRMFDHYNTHWQDYYGTEKTFIIE